MFPDRMPRAIFFDLDETLIDNTQGFDQIIAETFAEVLPDTIASGRLDPAAAEAIRGSAGKLWQNMFGYREEGKDALVEVFRPAMVVLEIDQAHAAAIAAVFTRRASDATTLREGVAEVFDALAAANIAVGIITNGIEALQREKIHRHQLQQRVDKIIVSEQAGAHKPDAKVFEYALGQLDVTAGESWHVGDHPLNDVTGAISSGMTGILYAPTANHLDKYQLANARVSEPHYTVEHLGQLQSLLEKIHQAQAK